MVIEVSGLGTMAGKGAKQILKSSSNSTGQDCSMGGLAVAHCSGSGGGRQLEVWQQLGVVWQP